MSLYGAYIKIQIDFNGSLKDLGVILSKNLDISEFHYDTDMFPPHGWFASCEAMGFEVEVRKVENKEKYIFYASTMDSFKEIAQGKMYSLSEWFARYVELKTELPCTPLSTTASNQKNV